MGIKVNGKDGHMVVAKYSEQARVIIEGRKDFNKLEFEKWFFKELLVGGMNVISYLQEKDREAKLKIEAKKILDGEKKDGNGKC